MGYNKFKVFGDYGSTKKYRDVSKTFLRNSKKAADKAVRG
jgi:hypothetical protein